jgi:hypothetical protein
VLKHEFYARVGQTLLARTFGELTAVTADIVAWSTPRPVRKPAKTPSRPAHAVDKAVACAIVALAAIALPAIAIAGMPGMPTKPVPRNMSIAACYAFMDWIGDHSDVSTLNHAVHDAWRGTNHALEADLADDIFGMHTGGTSVHRDCHVATWLRVKPAHFGRLLLSQHPSLVGIPPRGIGRASVRLVNPR